MEVVVACHQPHVFWPIHLVHRVFMADEFVLMDRVQINRKVGMTRYKVAQKTKDGLRVIELSVPFRGGARAMVNEAELDVFEPEFRTSSSKGWVDQHLTTLEHCYKHAPFWEDTKNIVEVAYRGCLTLVDFGVNSFNSVRRRAGLDHLSTKMRRQSEIQNGTATGAELISTLVGACCGTTYICGKPEDRPYLTDAFMKERGVDVESQDFHPPPDGNLSWLHFYAWGGSEGLRKVLDDGSSTSRRRFRYRSDL